MYIGGKQTEAVKTLVSDEFKQQLTRFWRERGYQSESDFVREVLIATVFGPDFLADLHRRRVESLFRSTAETGTPRASGAPAP